MMPFSVLPVSPKAVLYCKCPAIALLLPALRCLLPPPCSKPLSRLTTGAGQLYVVQIQQIRPGDNQELAQKTFVGLYREPFIWAQSFSHGGDEQYVA